MIEVPHDDYEDLRCGVVMSGGVSMAVWMGGVAREIDRLRRGAGPYAELLAVTQSTSRVDVIAGTSAGGLNGALLATAVAFDGRLDGLRDVWMHRGSFDALLRSPKESDPPSLLRGDAYFLPQLRDAVKQVAASSPLGPNRAPAAAAEHVRLIMMTTLFEPMGQRFADALGSEMHDADYRGRFEFRAASFAKPDFAARVALAARSSAAHPGGFEPSWVPVGPVPAGAPPIDELHPDMADEVSWKGCRFALDGGLVVNRPLEPAIEAIFEQPAKREVRRLVLFVTPDPPSEPDVPKLKALPQLRSTVSAALSIPRQQTIGEALRKVEAHNGNVHHRRGVRIGALDDAVVAGTGVDEAYAEIRGRQFAEACATVVRSIGFQSDPRELSCAPDQLVQVLAAEATEAFRPGPSDRWRFWKGDLNAVEGAALTVLDLMRKGLGMGLATSPGDALDARAVVREGRALVHGVLAELRQITDARTRWWESASVDASPESLALKAVREWPTAATDQVLGLAVLVAMTAELIREPLAQLAALAHGVADRSDADELMRVFAPAAAVEPSITLRLRTELIGLADLRSRGYVYRAALSRLLMELPEAATGTLADIGAAARVDDWERRLGQQGYGKVLRQASDLG